MRDADRFVHDFAASWGDPIRFPAMYAPAAKVRTPIARRLIARAELAGVVERIRTLLPDVRFAPMRWLASSELVFLEWRITGTFGDEPLTWEGISRFTLGDQEAVEEVVHFDTLPLWERIDPAMRRGDLIDPSGWKAAVDEAAANVERVRRYYDEVWNRGDLRALAELVHPEVVGHDPAAGAFDFDGLAEFVRSFRSAFPDFETHGERIVAQGDTVALRFRSEGTFQNEFMGLSPTGRRFCNTGLVMYRFESDRIVEIWVEWDHQRFLRELGASSESGAVRDGR